MELVAPLLFSIILWWSTTALVMFLDGMDRGTYRWTRVGATILLLVALAGLTALRSQTTVVAAYLSFTAALSVWGWQEVFFLTGTITGPRRHACEGNCHGWRHFVHGIQAILHHEMALLVGALTMVILHWTAPNKVALWTYLLLWGMRQSAKLNLFLGVRNLGSEFLPTHMAYLNGFFRKRRMNPLFPFSMAVLSAVAWVLCKRALTSAASLFEETAVALLAALTLLGLLEHVLLMLPIPASALWGPGLTSHRRTLEARRAAEGVI